MEVGKRLTVWASRTVSWIRHCGGHVWSQWGSSPKEWLFICWFCHEVMIKRRGTDIRFGDRSL